MRQLFALIFLLLFYSTIGVARIFPDSVAINNELIDNDDITIELPRVIISNIKSEITITFEDPAHPKLSRNDNTVIFLINETPVPVNFENGKGITTHDFSDGKPLTVQHGDFKYVSDKNPIPLWLSILPPLVAIIMALIFKEVITSLFIGIFIGGLTIGVYSEGIKGIFSGLLSVIDRYIINSLNNWDHLAVIIFSMVIGAIVSIISRNGGMQGVVNIISRYAKDARSGQLATWFLGIAIFFDDYANTLIVGNTMRPMTDKLRISREKLSYIVDSTAAPIASIAFVTTWIGFELGYIESSVQSIGIKEGAYSVFINSLQYSFYPIFTLLFVLMLIYQGKDYGSMLKAEIRSRTTGKLFDDHKEDEENGDNSQSEKGGSTDLSGLQPIAGAHFRWYNAVIPITVVIFGTIAGLIYTGNNNVEWTDEELGLSRKLSMIIGASDSYFSLLWASLCGLLTAILLTLSQKIMSLAQTIESAMSGFKTMFGAIMILTLSWALALVTEELHTADFITNTMLSGGFTPGFIPAITFILAALIAFSTGSSWGAMAILYPLMLPAAWQVCLISGMDTESTMAIFYNVVSCVLAGAVLGDHCSPISDTTILSSLASSCNHIDHVRTQLPYALTVGGIAIVFGTIPAAMGASPLITFPVGILVMYLIISFIGEKVEDGKDPIL